MRTEICHLPSLDAKFRLVFVFEGKSFLFFMWLISLDPRIIFIQLYLNRDLMTGGSLNEALTYLLERTQADWIRLL